jgi:uncharacterized protein YkwD
VFYNIIVFFRRMRFVQHILLIGLVFFLIPAQGQKTSDTVDAKAFSTEFLDTLVFETLIKKRFEHKLAKLFWSDEMMIIAKEHVSEMNSNDKLTYRELRKGQCIVALAFENNSITYQDLADQIIAKWLNSPGHRKLILGEFFIYGATANAFTLDDKGHVLFKGVFYVSYEP